MFILIEIRYRIYRKLARIKAHQSERSHKPKRFNHKSPPSPIDNHRGRNTCNHRTNQLTKVRTDDQSSVVKSIVYKSTNVTINVGVCTRAVIMSEESGMRDEFLTREFPRAFVNKLAFLLGKTEWERQREEITLPLKRQARKALICLVRRARGVLPDSPYSSTSVASFSFAG